MQALLLTGQVARLLGIRQHRIDYAICNGQLADARLHFLGKRCFDTNDVRRIAKHFGVALPKGGSGVQV